MKKLILMIVVVIMAFTASFAQEKQHNGQTTRENTTYQGSHRYRSQSRMHHMRTRHRRPTSNDHQ